jgi:GT2 family glycosyltransferase
LSKNTFFPGGFNNGIAVLGDDSGFDAYWLLSNDIRLPDRRTLVTLADDLQKAPKAAMVSPCLTLDRKRPGANVGFMVTGAGRGIKAMHWVEWQAPLILSSAWQKVGSLDENFPFWGMEMDWCYRARQVKYQILIDYSVVIQHEHDTTFNAHPEMKKEFNLEKLNELFFKGMRKKWGAGWYSKLWPTNADGLRHYEREHYG